MSKKTQNSLTFLARDNENSTKPEGSQNTSGHQSKRLSDAYFEHGFDGIKEILKIYCSLPISNADVERGIFINESNKNLF